MGWVRRQVDQHQCPLPKLDKDARPKDVWQCNTCKVYYEVRDNPRDGLYFERWTGVPTAGGLGS